MNSTILCIGDAHVEADQGLDRFDALGNFILEQQPEYIVSIGDFLSIDALSRWTLNKRALIENKRFKKELESGRDALIRITKPLANFNKNKAQKKKKQYNPKKIYIEGNHEQRWTAYLETHPELINIVDIYTEIGAKENGWSVVPYRSYVYISGIGFTHVPMNGVNMPISGMRYMQTAATAHSNSVVFGHTHRLAFETYARHGENERPISIVNVGWYGDEIPAYAKGSQGSKNWWSGLVMLDVFDNGQFNMQTYAIDKIKAEYL